MKLTQEQTKELAKAVKNFNQKLKRLQKQGTIDTNLTKLSTIEIKKQVTTNRELKKRINSIKRFSQRGAEESSKVQGLTKYEVSEARHTINLEINKLSRKEEKLQKTQFLYRGKETGQTIAEAHPERIKEIKVQKFELKQLKLELSGKMRKLSQKSKETVTTSRRPSQIRASVKKITYGSYGSTTDRRAQTFYNNYLYAVNYTFGNTNQAKKIKEKIKAMTPDSLYNFVQKDDTLLTFLDNYNDMGENGKEAFFEGWAV